MTDGANCFKGGKVVVGALGVNLTMKDDDRVRCLKWSFHVRLETSAMRETSFSATKA